MSLSKRFDPKFKPKILWVAVTPASYIVLLFEHFQRNFLDGFEFYFLYNAKKYLPWETKAFENAKFKYTSPHISALRILNRLVLCRDVTFIFSGWSGNYNVLLLTVAIIFRRKFIVWTDTPLNRKTRKHWIRNFFIRRIADASYAVYGTGKLAIRVLSDIGVKQNKLKNFPYWVSIPEKVTEKPSDGVFHFACIGRLVKYKGFDTAIAASGMIAGKSVQLHIIGTGPEEEVLRRQANELCEQSRIKFHGWMSNDQILSFLAEECHCLIHPVRSLEPYGVVVVEAMARAVPVISTVNCGAAVDRIEDMKNGFLLCTPLTVDDLFVRMNEIQGDRKMHREMSLMARKEAEKWPLERASEILLSPIMDSK